MSYRVINGPHTGAVGVIVYESAYAAVLKLDSGEEFAVMKEDLEEVDDV